MTIQELRERQSWSLYQKIDHAVAAIESFITKSGKVPYISFSGGKDSTVLLDIARRFVNPNMKAVFCNTGNEFPEIVRFVNSFDNVTIIRPEITVEKVIEKYGFPLISKEQAQYIRQAKTTKSEKLLRIRLHGTSPEKGWTSGKISECWKFLIYKPFMISEECCNRLKKRPFEVYHKQTEEVPIIGTMTEESKLRQQQYLRRGGCNSFSENHTASYPLSIFLDMDIWQYIREFKIPYCPIYDRKNVDRTGCRICGFDVHLEKESRFDILFDYYPKAYKIYMNYQNNGITYREALRAVGVLLPDEVRQLKLFTDY